MDPIQAVIFDMDGLMVDTEPFARQSWDMVLAEFGLQLDEPTFDEMFQEFNLELPAMTQMLIEMSRKMAKYWFVIPAVPITMVVFIMIVRKFKAGRMGWDQYMLQIPIVGKLVEKNILARTTRTLGTLVVRLTPNFDWAFLTAFST